MLIYYLVGYSKKALLDYCFFLYFTALFKVSVCCQYMFCSIKFEGGMIIFEKERLI